MIAPPSIRRPGRPRRHESADIEQRLVDAAMRMMVKHGPGLTMNTIISASGLSRKTVYARYPNKSALLADVVLHMLDYGLEPLTVPDRTDWRESLSIFIHGCLREVCLPQAMALRRLIMLDPAFMEAAKPRIEQVVVHRYIDPLIVFLRHLIECGAIPGQDIDFAAEALTNLVLSESHRRFFQNEENDDDDNSERLERHARSLTRLFCGGILAPENNIPA